MFNGCTELVTVGGSIKLSNLIDSNFQMMFYGCKALKNLPMFDVSATTAPAACFNAMFYDCEALEDLPIGLFANITECAGIGSFDSMFSGCKALKSPQSDINSYIDWFKVTTLSSQCCKQMFVNCKALTKAPKLPASTAASSCYREMFSGCTNLNEICCLLKTRASIDTSNWVLNVTNPNGVFKKKTGITWPSGASGIPNGWTVVEVDE